MFQIDVGKKGCKNLSLLGVVPKVLEQPHDKAKITPIRKITRRRSQKRLVKNEIFFILVVFVFLSKIVKK